MTDELIYYTESSKMQARDQMENVPVWEVVGAKSAVCGLVFLPKYFTKQYSQELAEVTCTKCLKDQGLMLKKFSTQNFLSNVPSTL